MGDDELPVELVGAAPDGTRGVDRPPATGRWAGLAVAAVLAALIGAAVLGPDDRGPPTGSSVAEPTVPTTSGPLTTAATGTTRGRDEPDHRSPVPARGEAAPFPAVQLVTGAAPLAARLALAPVPFDDLHALWIVDGARLVSRTDVPTYPFDWAYPILFAGDGVVFPHRLLPWAHHMAGDAASVTTIESGPPITEVIAGAEPGHPWAVHSTNASIVVAPGADRVSHLTRLGDGTPETFAVEGLATASAGVAAGVVGHPDGAGGGLVHWAPGRPPVPLTSVVGDELAVLAAVGDLLAVADRSARLVVVVDVRTDRRVAEIPMANALPTACFSPDGRRLALRRLFVPAEIGPSEPLEGAEPRRQVTVADLGSEPPALRSHGASGDIVDMTWTANDELVLVTEREVLAVGVPAMTARPVAELAGADDWWVTSEAATC